MITLITFMISLYITFKVSVVFVRMMARLMKSISFFSLFFIFMLMGSLYEGSASLFLLSLFILFLIHIRKNREGIRETEYDLDKEIRTVKYEPVKETVPVKELDENGKILSSTLQELYSMRKLVNGLRNETIRNNALRLCDRAKSILDVLRINTDQITSVRQFWNYYLPSTNSILKKYDRLERSGVADWETTQKVNQYLNDVNVALDNLYHSLFDVDKKSLNIEMEAMQLAMQREGLVSNDEVIDHEGGIRLAI